MDIKNGRFKISEQIEIHPNFTFEEYKKSVFYKGEDGVRIIYLDKPQNIDKEKYIVSLFFRKNVIYLVSLIYCEIEISEEEEAKRKKIHDKILMKKGIDVGKQYYWGKVTSEYDAKGNISSINIYYNSGL